MTIFWSDAGDLLRILIVAPLAYAALVLILRVSGKRMLSKMSAFDLVVTIALGSTLATIIMSKDLALVQGVTALGLLIGLQYLVAWSAARSDAIRRIIKSEPRLLFFRGEFLRDALRKENVSAEAVRMGMRQHGYAREEEVGAVVLEADGSLSIMPAAEARATTLEGVVGAPERDAVRTGPSS